MSSDSRLAGSLFPPSRFTAVDRLLMRSSRYSFILLLISVLSSVALIGFLVVRDLRSANNEIRRIYHDSVEGMQSIGELQYDTQETRRAILYALTTSDSNLQLVYADQTRAADHRVQQSIALYARHAKSYKGIDIAHRLDHDWEQYLAVRDDVLASILEGSISDAVNRDLARGVPDFDRVRQDLLDARHLYAEEAARSEQKLDASWRQSAIRLAFMFTVAFLLCTAAVWAVQRAQLLGRMQLAELQIEFVASVSHELRTPLAVIRSAADNLADGIVQSNEALVRYGGVLQHQSRSMSELVDQILLFASTEARFNPPELARVEVAHIISSLREHAQVLEYDSSFRFAFDVQQRLPGVFADLAAVTRILQNIMDNAVKYGGDDRLVRVRAYAASQQVCISVSDSGIGIDPGELEQIFDPFYRSARVKAAQIHGTGLGLPVARRLAESIGASITVSSAPRRGSTFTLHLQIAKEEAVTGVEKSRRVRLITE